MKKVIAILIVGLLVGAGIIGILMLSTPDKTQTSERELIVEPYRFRADDGRLIELNQTAYFNGREGVGTASPSIQSIAFRLYPASGTSTTCDRFYTAEGSGSGFAPYGLYAYNSTNGGNQWIFETGSKISTKVLVNNFGSETNASAADLRIFFGCENGKLYILRDSFLDPIYGPSPPAGNNVWAYTLDGGVVGIAYSDVRGGWLPHLKANPFNNYDSFFVSTKNGTLYAFEGPTPIINSLTGQYNVTNPTLLWKRHISNVSLTSPTVSETGDSVFIGTIDGLLYGIDVASGLDIPEWNGPYRISYSYWTTSPVAVGAPVKIYATTSEGFIHCLWGSNGTVKSGWTHIENQVLNNGIQVRNKRYEVDGGNLTDIFMVPDGSYLLFGSDTGVVYSINTNTINVSIAFDTRIGTQDTEVNVMPYYDWRFSRYLFVTARHLNNTITNPSDDFSIIYCLASPGNSTVIWRLVKNGVMVASPICYINMNHLGSSDVVFSTTIFDLNGTPIAGKMYSYSSSGGCIEINEKSIPGFDLLTISVATITAVAIVKITRKTTRKK